MVTVQSGDRVGRRLVYNGFRGHKQPGDINHPEMSLSFSLHKMVLVTWHQCFWGTKTYHQRTASSSSSFMIIIIQSEIVNTSPSQGVPLSLKHRSVSVSSHSTCLHSPDCAPSSMMMMLLISLKLNSKSTISFLFQFEFMQHDDSFVWGEVGEGQAWYILSRLSLSSVGGGHHQHWTLAGLHHRNGGGGVTYIYIPRYLWHPIVNNRLWWNFWMSQYFEPWCWRMTSARHQTLERLHHDISAPSLYLDSLSISDGFILQIVLNAAQSSFMQTQQLTCVLHSKISTTACHESCHL